MDGTPLALLLADSPDVPALAALAGAAFARDRHTQLKALGAPPYEHEAGMRAALPHWLAHPHRYAVVKAVARGTGAVAGWACWGQRGCGGAAVGAGVVREDAEPGAGAAGVVEEKDGKGEGDASDDGGGRGVDGGGDAVARLEGVTGADLRRWMDVLMPEGARCMYVVAIAVEHAWQGQGVGSALVRWGTERADAAGVFCWVHASEPGHGLFEKSGFEVVGVLDVDLDEYAPAPCPVDGTDGMWGRYLFRYMKRMPIVL